MASYKDYEALWQKYQNDGVGKGISIIRYCESHGFQYKQFEHWYKNYFKQRSYEIEIVGAPEEDGREVLENQKFSRDSQGQIQEISIKLKNGLSYNKENISYATLYTTLKKLEVLCLA